MAFKNSLKIIPIKDLKIELFIVVSKKMDKIFREKILAQIDKSNSRYQMYLDKTSQKIHQIKKIELAKN